MPNDWRRDNMTGETRVYEVLTAAAVMGTVPAFAAVLLYRQAADQRAANRALLNVEARIRARPEPGSRPQ